MARTRVNRRLRFLDRWAGIPFVVLLGVLHRRRRLDPRAVKRIGLMKTVAIGDTLMIAGVLADIRSAFPAADVVIITGEDNRVAGDMIGGSCERVIISPFRPMASILAVRRARLDVIIDFGPWARFDAALAALSAARFKIGFRTPGQLRHLAYDFPVDHRWDVHEVENFRRLAAALGVVSTSEPRITPPGALAKDRRPPAPYAVFHPWSGGFMHYVKEWPADQWVSLGAALAARGWTIVLSGSLADAGKSGELAAAFAAANVPVEDCAGRFDLRELADVFAGAMAVVSVNTGVMHLAGQVGARTVSLEGPTSAGRWRPRGPHVRPVETRLAGCGYLNLGWEYAGNRLDCMSGIPVADVLQAIDELLRG